MKPGKYRFDVGTAGATGLVLHTLYLPLALRGGDIPSELTLIGGTHVSTSPCFHFLDVTWRRYLEAFGLRLSLTMFRPGFYPRGGGVVEVHIQPCTRLHGVSLPERGPVKATGFSAAAGLPESVAHRQARRAAYRLREHGLEVDIPRRDVGGRPRQRAGGGAGHGPGADAVLRPRRARQAVGARGR